MSKCSEVIILLNKYAEKVNVYITINNTVIITTPQAAEAASRLRQDNELVETMSWWPRKDAGRRE
jgi:hypothetical protein